MSKDDQSCSLSDKSYKELSIKRSSIKGQITKFINYLNNISLQPELTNIQLTELNLKLAKFEALSMKFDDLQIELDVLNSANILVEIEERSNIEQDMILSIATAKDLLERYSKRVECDQRRNSAVDNSCCVGQQEIGIKLPQIQIAKFDGAYFRWLEFRDTFENLIHRNERIPSINKFHYLMSYLEGDAARIISNLEISSANYVEAWKLLCNRYNNKRILINQHLNSLFNIKQLPQESERSLRFLIDHVTKNLRALASLGQPTDKWDVLIIFMLSSKLDSTTLLKWEEYRNNLSTEVPTLDQFFKFITDRADVLEALCRNKQDRSISKPQAPPTRNNYNTNNNNQRLSQNIYTKSFANVNNNTKYKSFHCIICNENHKIYDCPTFKSKGIDDRMNDVIKYKLCVNCLRQGHPAPECRMGPCRECKRRHNSLLHRPSSSVNHFVAENNEGELEESIVNFSKQCANQVLLSTAMIEVSNPLSQQKVKVRALLDCGSQSSFITESLKTKLLLNTQPIESLKVIGIGNNIANNVVETGNIQIKSVHSNFNLKLSCLILKEITGSLPKTPINISLLKLPTGIQLADPMFHQPGPIEVLIGADIFWDILSSDQRSLGPNNPKLINSKLGWIVSGPINSISSLKTTHSNHATVAYSLSEEFADYIKKFSDLEEIPNKIVISKNDKVCEDNFLQHTKRDNQGRFYVRLPLKDTPDCLGDSYRLARKRFGYLEKRFKRNPTLKLEYTKFIREYAELGHLSRSDSNLSPAYYLCHHAVIKQESESTKLRVVFDGSAASTSGYSLNDLLLVGPNVQNSLFSILVRARQYKYLLTGDIEKMYRQVMVSKEDRNLQLILWREDESMPVETLKLNTLTYGTASASYLSTRCLAQLGKEHDDDFIREIIENDFYVDDLITGADDEKTLNYIQKSVSSALLSGCFNLRKYKSNHPAVFKNIDMNTHDNLIISETTSTLGLGWTPSTDTFHFLVKNYSIDNEVPITKRTIMSNSFKLFDPLGLLSPVVVQPKILLQKLWQLKSAWDEPVPEDIKNNWLNFSNSLKTLANLNIPRLVLGNSLEHVELHSFSDASQAAYGACIYMVSRSTNGDVTVRLLCAKSKIAPAKPTTIPRLELCAALLAAKLCKVVLESIRYKPKRLVHWCDSSAVLSWINTDLSKLKMFVANRISEVGELTCAASWRYVPTALNPADLISRGVDAGRLLSIDLWWSGPDFLRNDSSGWPSPLLKNDDQDILNEIKTHSALVTEPLIKFENYSSFNKLRRTFAFVLRFIHNTRHPNKKRVSSLSTEELQESFYSLCAIAQSQSFPSEYELLIKGKPLNNKNKILSLSPFLSENKLIRVGGRLDAADCSYEVRHPILLHASHQLTKLYFIKEHIINFHSGPQLLLAQVRQTVWPVNGRLLARRTVSKCVVCRRFRGQTFQPKMGNLPAQRVNVDYPFLSVGVDYAGPFFITNRKGRGARLIKCYLCLFVCLRFKCLHLEAVSDLTADAFIMTLRRFIARRGKPVEIFSDNGRNFVAAAKEIGKFIHQNKETITDFASDQGIKFMFIPAYGPHFGGIWESGVKSAKHHLRRVIGNCHLTFEEISTLFAQIEAILNSRPLCPLSSSPNDYLPLSPGHFLIGRPMTALPLPAPRECSQNQLTRYERLETIRQHFWQRWQQEYLSELQQRTKWRTDKSKLSVGDMVLISEDNTPPLAWRLGRILRLISGPDGVTRVADVNTTRGVVRRSLTRLCPLPTTEELSS